MTVAELKKLLEEVPDDYVVMNGYLGGPLHLADNIIVDEDKELWL